ncbi:MAG TPA: protein-glutamate O-methyltransferase CheR [Verrucomicrobiae bacterium]|nr:protein-glutamate O-methyltransferase CheR [Verrucomicrobiae bacterium]
MSLGSYEQFTRYFRDRNGLDLACYKQTQMQRRIEQFITNKGFCSYQAFREHLDSNNDLMSAFMRHLTINVTQFFRDASQWELLRSKILPGIIQNHNCLKIWSAGCSGGQEAYTLAITLQEYFPGTHYSIIGTDIDHAMLAQARNGVYKASDLQGVPEGIVRKYFSEHPDGGFVINDRLRQNVVFQNKNLLTGLFDTGFHLICCRNVVIYFTEETKNILYDRFAKSLQTGGVLFSGSTEQIFNLHDLGFKSLAPFFYQKI